MFARGFEVRPFTSPSLVDMDRVLARWDAEEVYGHEQTLWRLTERDTTDVNPLAIEQRRERHTHLAALRSSGWSCHPPCSK
jgi:hypothetical protein